MQSIIKSNILLIKNFGSALVDQFDYFAQQPQLRIFSKKRFSTRLGFILTCGVIFICIIQLYSLFKEILNKTSPNIVNSEFQQSNTEEFKLHPHNQTLAIALLDSQLQTIPGQFQIFNITIRNCQRKRIFNETTGITQSTFQCYYYPIEECNEKKHFITDVQKSYFQKFNKSGLYCLNSEIWLQRPFQLQGTSTSSIFQYLDVQISMCQNSTEFKKCKSTEIIQKQLQNGYLVIHSSDVLSKLENPNFPFQSIIQASYYSYSIYNTNTILCQQKYLVTVSDVGLIFDSYKQDFALQKSSVQETMQNYNNKYFFQYQIILDSRMTQYKRSYIKLQQAFGYVGGLWQSLYLILSIFLTPITILIAHIQLANEHFRFEQSENRNNLNIIKNKIFLDEFCCQAVENEFPSQSERFGDQKKISSRRLEDSIDVEKFFKHQQTHQIMKTKDILQATFCCKKSKKNQFDYAIKKVFSKLDVSYIISKFQEIDKLKLLLLSKDQLNLFNYIPKPIIPFHIQQVDFFKNIEILEKKVAYKLLLDDEKSEQFKINQAFISYLNLKAKNSLTVTDQQILQFLDDDLRYIFDSHCTYKFQNQLKINQPILDLESLCESRVPVRDSIIEQQIEK